MCTSRYMRFAFSVTSKTFAIFLIATRAPVRWSIASATEPYEPLPSRRFTSKRVWSISHAANCVFTLHVGGGMVYDADGITIVVVTECSCSWSTSIIDPVAPSGSGVAIL